MSHSHARIVILDNSIRNLWYGQGGFALSAGLFASAKRKHITPGIYHDSSRPGNGSPVQDVQGDFWISSVTALASFDAAFF